MDRSFGPGVHAGIQVTDLAVRQLVAERGDTVADLHCWAVAPGKYALILAVVSDDPQSPDHYKSLIPSKLKIVHATVEVHQCADH